VRFWVSKQRACILTKEILEKRITLSALKGRLRFKQKHK